MTVTDGGDGVDFSLQPGSPAIQAGKTSTYTLTGRKFDSAADDSYTLSFNTGGGSYTVEYDYSNDSSIEYSITVDEDINGNSRLQLDTIDIGAHETPYDIYDGTHITNGNSRRVWNRNKLGQCNGRSSGGH